MINAKLVKTIGEKNDVNEIDLKTVNDVKKTNGLITIKIKIFEIEEDMDVYIIENEDFDDFMIGLDMIKNLD